jgi:ABC-type polysaccharide/polyol phosphate export permease
MAVKKQGRLRKRKRERPAIFPSVRYALGRLLQITALCVTLVAATAFFGTSSTIAMLRMMLAGVLLFLPGWWLTRKAPPAD